MQKIVLTFIFYLFFALSYSIAQSTSYIWEPDNKKADKGYCYKIDNATSGINFKAKADLEKCRPELTNYMFVSKKSNCYEVDSKTNGKKYIKKVKIKNCLPDKTVKEILLINGKTACYEVDEKTKGQYYHKKIKNKECKNNIVTIGPTNFFWKYKSPGLGECFKEIKSNGKELKFKVKAEECRPKNFQFRFIRKNDTSGTCVEEDTNDQRYYSNKTLIENCKPAETVYVFYTPKNKKQGQCFEIDIETKGNLYINVVDDSECAPE